jgi:hypothetical protein
LKTSILFVVSFFALNCYTQVAERYAMGSIEFRNGEKHDGLIKDDEISAMNFKVYFRASKDLKTFTAFDTSTVRKVVLTTGEVYESVRFKPYYETDSITVLGKLKLKGKASLYEVYYKSDYILIVVNYGKGFALQEDKLESNALEMKNYYFKTLLANALNDNSFNARIEKLFFRPQNIIDLLLDYNGKDNSEIIIPVEKKAAQHFIITDLGGMYKNSSENEMFFQTMYRTYFPKISKSTSLNIGASVYLSKCYLNYWGDKISLKRTLFSAPLQIQQNLLNKMVRPYIFGGFNLSYVQEKTNSGIIVLERGFQRNFGINLLWGGGIEADVYRGFRLKTEYRYENYGHLIAAGIGFCFSKN